MALRSYIGISVPDRNVNTSASILRGFKYMIFKQIHTNTESLYVYSYVHLLQIK